MNNTDFSDIQLTKQDIKLLYAILKAKEPLLYTIEYKKLFECKLIKSTVYVPDGCGGQQDPDENTEIEISPKGKEYVKYRKIKIIKTIIKILAGAAAAITTIAGVIQAIDYVVGQIT